MPDKIRHQEYLKRQNQRVSINFDDHFPKLMEALKNHDKLIKLDPQKVIDPFAYYDQE